MKVYNCIVQLGSNNGGPNPHHEVPRMKVPRSEIMLLRSIHGADGVTSIKHVGESDLSDMDVYKAMAAFYPKYVGSIEKLFGVSLAIAGNDATQLDAGLDDDLDADESYEAKSEDVPAPIPTFLTPDGGRAPVEEQLA